MTDIQSVRAPTPDQISRYSTGECHVFALAMHRRFGWPILVVTNPNEPYWVDPVDDDNSIPSVLHVYALDDAGRAWDIRGWRMFVEVEGEIHKWLCPSAYDSFTLHSEDELRVYVGAWGETAGEVVERPLFSYSDQDLAEADQDLLATIATDPSFPRLETPRSP